jgi:hypothetical protein
VGLQMPWPLRVLEGEEGRRAVLQEPWVRLQVLQLPQVELQAEQILQLGLQAVQMPRVGGEGRAASMAMLHMSVVECRSTDVVRLVSDPSRLPSGCCWSVQAALQIWLSSKKAAVSFEKGATVSSPKHCNLGQRTPQVLLAWWRNAPCRHRLHAHHSATHCWDKLLCARLSQTMHPRAHLRLHCSEALLSANLSKARHRQACLQQCLLRLFVHHFSMI